MDQLEQRRAELQRRMEEELAETPQQRRARLDRESEERIAMLSAAPSTLADSLREENAIREADELSGRERSLSNLDSGNRRGRQSRGRERNSDFIAQVSDALITRVEEMLRKLDSIEDPIEYIKAYKAVHSMLPKYKEVNHTGNVQTVVVGVMPPAPEPLSLEQPNEEGTGATEATETAPQSDLTDESTDLSDFLA